jgi:hypothetical protein
MSKSNYFANAFMQHIFNNIAISNIGDGAGLPAGVEGSLYVTLHTATPDETGDASTNETNYTDYQRVAVARNAGGWTVAAEADPASTSPTADIDFIECGATPGNPITHFGVTTAGVKATADELLYWGTVSPPITMATGVIPRIKTTSTITED